MSDDNTNSDADKMLPTNLNPENGAPNPLSGKLPPELWEWAQQQVTDEEIMAGLEEIRKTGGLKFSDFLPELEQAAHD